MKTKHLLPSILTLCMTAASCNAATILFDFNSTTIAFAANLGAGALVTTNDFSGDSVTVSNWTASSPVRTIGVQGGQVRALKSEDNDTHQFTITIPSDVSLDFTALSFTYGNFGADTSPANFTVTSSVSGGTFSQATWTHAASTNFSGTANITLAGNFLSDLTNRTVTFTFTDAAQGNNLSTSMYTFIDNVTLTGTVVPEPGAALFGCLGLLALLRRRRA